MSRIGAAVGFAVLLGTACGTQSSDEASTSDEANAQSSLAQRQPVRDVRDFYSEETVPAGAVCDFSVKFVSSEVVSRVRFFNEYGIRIRAILQVAMINEFTNLSTGGVLIEEIHFTVQNEFDSAGQGPIRQIVTGRDYAMRDANGILRVQSAGRTVFDVDEDTFTTPNVITDWSAAVCPALAVAPAP